MNLQQLEYFKLIAEKGNYTTASKILGVTQSSLSHAVSKLENELKVTLFEKQGRNIKLSQNGREFYLYVKQALDILSEGKSKMLTLSDNGSNSIRIGHLHNVARDFAPLVINRFRKLGHTSTLFELSEGTTNALLDALLNNELEIAFTSKPSNPDTASSFSYIPVYEEELVVIAPCSHRLSSLRSVSLFDLDGEDFISYDERSGLNSLIHGVLDDEGIAVNTVEREVTDSAICRQVAVAKGVAIVPNTVDLADYNISAIKIKNNAIRRLIYLTWNRNRPISSHVLAFIEFMRESYEINDVNSQ